MGMRKTSRADSRRDGMKGKGVRVLEGTSTEPRVLPMSKKRARMGFCMRASIERSVVLGGKGPKARWIIEWEGVSSE
jgi:hypothetical protein